LLREYGLQRSDGDRATDRCSRDQNEKPHGCPRAFGDPLQYDDGLKHACRKPLKLSGSGGRQSG
jgi:hypothetical protein